LAIEAAYKGSSVALQLLVALPDPSASSKGGWLLEVEHDQALHEDGICKHEPDCWRLRSAQNIASPVSAEEKLRQVKLMISVAGVLG